MFVTTARRPQDGMASLRRLNSVLEEAFDFLAALTGERRPYLGLAPTPAMSSRTGTQ